MSTEGDRGAADEEEDEEDEVNVDPVSGRLWALERSVSRRDVFVTMGLSPFLERPRGLFCPYDRGPALSRCTFGVEPQL